MSDVTRTSEPTVIVGDASTKIRDAHIKGGQVCCTCGRDSSLDCRTPPPDTCESNLAICRRDRDAARDERDELRKENKELKQERNCLRDELEKCRHGEHGCGCHGEASRDRAQNIERVAIEIVVFCNSLPKDEFREHMRKLLNDLSIAIKGGEPEWGSALKLELAETKLAAEKLRAENETLRKIIADRDETVSRLATSCSKLDSKLQGCESKADEICRENVKLVSQNNALRAEVKRVNGDFDTVCKDLDDCRRKIENQVAYCQDLQLQAEASHVREANTAKQLETIVGAAVKLVAQRPGFGDPWTAVVPENFDALIRAVNGARQPLLATNNEATG